MTLCRHCVNRKATRPGLLCWPCYYTPGVRERYGVNPSKCVGSESTDNREGRAMLLLTAAETGRVFDKDNLLILWGLNIKARVYTADAPKYPYQNAVVELYARRGQTDADCEYFFITPYGDGTPVRPRHVTRVPDDTPVTIQYSPKVEAEIAEHRRKGIARAAWLVEYRRYVTDFAAAHGRGETPAWEPPPEPA